MALVLVAVLLSLATSAYSGFQARRAVEVASQALLSDFALARAEAIRRGNFVTICQSTNGAQCLDTSTAWHTGWLMFEGQAPPTAASPGVSVLRVQPALNGIERLTLTLGLNQTRLIFSPTGVGVSPAGRFTITPAAEPGQQRLLCINGGGLASLRAVGDTSC